MKRVIVALAFVLLGLWPACAAPDSPSPAATSAPTAPASARVEATEAQDNGTVVVALNGTLKIRLASNMAQGRRWHISKVNRDMLATKSVSYQQTSIKQPFAGGYDEFVFRVVKSGTDQVVINLETPKEQLKTFTLNVVVP